MNVHGLHCFHFVSLRRPNPSFPRRIQITFLYTPGIHRKWCSLPVCSVYLIDNRLTVYYSLCFSCLSTTLLTSVRKLQDDLEKAFWIQGAHDLVKHLLCHWYWSTAPLNIRRNIIVILSYEALRHVLLSKNPWTRVKSGRHTCVCVFNIFYSWTFLQFKWKRCRAVVRNDWRCKVGFRQIK